MGEPTESTGGRGLRGGNYKWVALSNTTLGMLAATVNASIVIIALPAIFRGIHLNPLQASNISYLLWMLMGYLVVSAVLVVTLGRLGRHLRPGQDVQRGLRDLRPGRAGAAVRPFTGPKGALWLIGFRVIQAIGGAMLMANSPAILTDAFPANQRGTAMGINQVAGISGQFIGLILGGVLAAVDWRLVFIVSVPIGIGGTIWSYLSLKETGIRTPGQDRLAGQRDFRGRPDLAADRHHLRHPALRRALDGLDQPAGADRADRRPGAADHVLHHRDQGRVPDVRPGADEDPGVRGRASARPCWPPSPAAACSSC